MATTAINFDAPNSRSNFSSLLIIFISLILYTILFALIIIFGSDFGSKKSVPSMNITDLLKTSDQGLSDPIGHGNMLITG